MAKRDSLAMHLNPVFTNNYVNKTNVYDSCRRPEIMTVYVGNS